MKKRLVILARLSAALSIVFVLFSAAMPSSVMAASVDDICAGVNAGSAARCGSGAPNGGRVGSVIRTAVNLFSIIVGIAAIIMIIIGAFRFVTSGGESSNIATARSTILYAMVGLVVVALSQFIVRFVLTKSVTTLPTCPAGETTLADGSDCLRP